MALDPPRLDLTSLRPAGPDAAKLVLLALVLYFMAGPLWDAERPSLLTGVIFYTHEAGHVVFAPFGDFVRTAGGSAMQLLVPAAFIVHFLRQGEAYSAAIAGLWLATSFMNVAHYAGDAQALAGILSHTWMSGQEELATYGETRHDWHRLLSTLGLLRATPLVGGAFALGGLATGLASVYVALLTAGVPVPARIPARWQGRRRRVRGRAAGGKRP